MRGIKRAFALHYTACLNPLTMGSTLSFRKKGIVAVFLPFTFSASLLRRRFLLSPQLPHRFILSGKFCGIVHEGRHGIANAAFMRGF